MQSHIFLFLIAITLFLIDENEVTFCCFKLQKGDSFQNILGRASEATWRVDLLSSISKDLDLFASRRVRVVSANLLKDRIGPQF